MKTKRELGLCEHWGCHTPAVVLVYPRMGDHEWSSVGYGLCSKHWDYKPTPGVGSKAELVATGQAKFRYEALS